MRKPRTFTQEQAERVRGALRRFVDRYGYGGQSRAAEVLGIAQQHISRLTKKDSPDPPGYPLAVALAARLGVSFESLINGDPETTEMRLERDDRYPNRASVIRDNGSHAPAAGARGEAVRAGGASEAGDQDAAPRPRGPRGAGEVDEEAAEEVTRNLYR